MAEIFRSQDTGRVVGDLPRYRRLRDSGAVARRRSHPTPTTAARATFVDVGGVVEPAPAPRFSRTPAPAPSPPPGPGVHATEALVQWGLTQSEIDVLVNDGVID